jgi:transposase
LYVDYTGKKLKYIDLDTGEILTAEIFVAILGCSQLTYVEASPSQKKEDFITSVERALLFFGGVPQCIVPDNLKSAVTKSDRYQPQINERFADFASHYGTTVVPARARKPRDKALVEGAVKIAYQRIFAPLRDKPYTSLAVLNTDITELLKEHNNKPMQRSGSSRMETFIATEQEALKALPQERYECKLYKWITVHKNAHILLSQDKHYYSVPYRYVGEKIKVVYTSCEVEIYHHCTRIAYHKRNYKAHKYTTVSDHMPSSHQFVADWNDEKFLSWATNIGAATQEAIASILKSKLHPEQAYKSCIGILTMTKKVGNERLNNACKRALEYQACNYKSIQNILDKGLDDTTVSEPPQYDLPFHDNIRGKEFYQ